VGTSYFKKCGKFNLEQIRNSVFDYNYSRTVPGYQTILECPSLFVTTYIQSFAADLFVLLRLVLQKTLRFIAIRSHNSLRQN